MTGKTHEYLRYVNESVFGLVSASSNGQVCYVQLDSNQGRYVAAAACEGINIWDIRTGTKVRTIGGLDQEDKPLKEVTALASFVDESRACRIIAAGYQDGSVRIYELGSGELMITFHGHKSSVNCLAFDSTGMRLASGGKDSEIVLWDIVNESGLYRLKSHKSPITKLQFMKNHNILISASKDTWIKFWDLDTQHCFKTLIAHRSEVWSFVLYNDDSKLISGASDSELKVWSINFSEQSTKPDQENNPDQPGESTEEIEENDGENLIFKIEQEGAILRKSAQRLSNLTVDDSERVLLCHGTDNLIEVFKLRTDEEVKEVLARKIRKEKKKLKRSDPGSEPEVPIPEPKLSDRIERLCEIRASSKVKAIDVVVKKNDCQIACALASNSLEIHSMPVQKPAKPDQPSEVKAIDYFGHRNDIRAIAFTSDNFSLLTASSDCVKVWNRATQNVQATIKLQREYPLCALFAPGDKYVIIGSKTGNLLVLDIGTAQVLETIVASEDGQPIWSICQYPNQKGLVTGSEDKLVKFWDYELVSDERLESKRLTLLHRRTLKLDEGVLCVKMTPNGKFIAVSLLDSTVKIFFVDSLKFFLSLYGHKFPVLSMDISYDSALIATGSSDKNIKIWGLDFGDCHKSIFAHDDSIMCLSFVPKTHYIFSGSRDKTLKQWDADSFQKIQTLIGHQAEIWALSVSPNGKFVATVSHDKSIRLWKKTEEILVLEEEQENEREEEFEKNALEGHEHIIAGEGNEETGIATKKTTETVKAVERLIEAIDTFKKERLKERQYADECKAAAVNGTPAPEKPVPEPLLAMYSTTCPYRFFLETLRRIKSSEMENALLTLPFNYVIDALHILCLLLERRWEVELLARCSLFLMRVHFGEITSNSSLIPVIQKLRTELKKALGAEKDIIGLNLAALNVYGRQIALREEVRLFADAFQKVKKRKKDKKRKIQGTILTMSL